MASKSLSIAPAISTVTDDPCRLPEIIQRVDRRYTEVVNALAIFPEQPLNPILTVSTEITELVLSIGAQIEGTQTFNPFLEQYRGAIRDLAKHLGDMKPEVDCSTPGYEKPAFELSDDDEMDTTPTYTPSKPPPSVKATPVRHMQFPSAPASSSRKRKVEEDIDTPLRGKAAAANVTKRTRVAQTSVCHVTFSKTTFKLDQVKAWYEAGDNSGPVSYTHLTLPTKRIV